MACFKVLFEKGIQLYSPVEIACHPCSYETLNGITLSKANAARNKQFIAKREGLFTDDIGNTYGDKIQVISVEDLLTGKRPQIPQSKYETFKKAEKKVTYADTQIKMNI
ncbi:MAG: hypothetical protein WCE64_10360 [Bacteroidales bacterium]